METVNVDKVRLIETVTRNLQNHREELAQARIGYRLACIELLRKTLKEFEDSPVSEAPQLLVREAMPEDHTSQYERTLRKLKMSVDKEIALTAQDYDNYVEDDWEWTRGWKMSNTKYLVGR